MKTRLAILCLVICFKTVAQIPEDALRYSWYPQTGTARLTAIGGAMGSLGGELSATFVNPAGIGMYKTGEFVFSPGLLLQQNNAQYLTQEAGNKTNGFLLGTTGFVFGKLNYKKQRNSHAFSFAFNQSVSFKNHITYQGLNDYSSYAEQFAEEFAKSGYSINDVLDSNSPLPYTSALALYTYLIDTISINGQLTVLAAPEYILDSGKAVMQQMDKKTNGGIYDFAVAFAHNTEDKFYWGVTLSIPFIHYESNTLFTESDTSSNVFNRFASFTHQDKFTTDGLGFNLKAGIIYKPVDNLRLGLAVHSPTIMPLTDTRTASMVSNLETPSGQFESFIGNSETFTNNQAGESKYTQFTPWKFLISGAYLFKEIADTRKQRGFITIDLEYINHKGSRFKSDNVIQTTGEKAYYNELNKTVKNIYKGTFNFRAGGELKWNTIMARLGFASYGNPYRDKVIDVNQLIFSGGIGYRNKGLFIDLSYSHRLLNDVNIPYRLEDRTNSYADLKQQQGTVMATVGIKF